MQGEFLDLHQFGLNYTQETADEIATTKQGVCVIRKPNKNRTKQPVENFTKKFKKSIDKI